MYAITAVLAPDGVWPSAGTTATLAIIVFHMLWLNILAKISRTFTPIGRRVIKLFSD